MRKKLLMAMLGLASVPSLTVPASAEGLLVVGANIVILPSSYYDGDKEWGATTWVYNSGINYGGNGQDNGNFNQICGLSVKMPDGTERSNGLPPLDAQGREWYEMAYDTTGTVGYNDDLQENIYWADHTAPFSSDETFNGRPSYQWTTNEIMAELYFRRFFTTDRLLSGDVYLACGHDDAPCEYYLNGVKVFEKTGYDEVDHWNYTYDEVTGEKLDSTAVYKNGWNNAEYIKLTDEQKALIKLNGEKNLLAVHVHQNWGGAFADCGLYTKVEGGLPMGYEQPWTAKVLFNSWGGYNTGGLHDWEKLYQAQADDKYTIHLLGRNDAEWTQQVQFRTPINIDADRSYTLKMNITASKPMGNVTLAVTELDDDNVKAGHDVYPVEDGEETPIEMELSGVAIKDAKIQFNFATLEKGTDVTISGMSLVDETDGKELWVGTSYYNYCYVTDIDTIRNEEDETETYVARQIADPVIDGRVETLSWTDPDFDDSMWSDQEMPMGNAGYMPELKSIWPGHMGHLDYTGDGEEGHNTNYWVRRTFTLDKINERLSYALNVCHDDTYWTYVNGHLLQNFDGWTDGKNPKQVHIPAKYLREGKNVIATYIRQNWGGRFYDCGINVEEVNYDDCANELKAAIALADTTATITKAMQAQLDSLVAAAKNELENNKDAAEVKEYAKNLTTNINAILAYAGDVNVLLQTIAICEKTQDKGYLKETLDAVKVGIDTCVNTAQTNALLADLRLARKRNALERHTETFVGSQPEAYDNESADPDSYPAGAYYIYNVGERLYLSGGENWGAHAALAYASNAFHLINTDMDGNPLEKGFRIETMRPNGDNSDFLNYGGYVDCVTNEAWEFVPVEGKTNVFNICRVTGNPEEGGAYMLGYRDGKDNQFAPSYNVVDTDMRNGQSEANQWMLISKAELDGMMANATEEHPVAATHLIVNPGFDQRLDISQWYTADMGKGKNENGDEVAGLGVWGRGDNHPDFALEAWNCTTGTVTQDIFDKGVVPGWYTLTAQIYYRDGRYEDHTAKYLAGETLNANAQLIAGESVDDAVAVEVPFVSDYANAAPGLGRLDATGTVWMSDGCASSTEDYFENGCYWSTPVLFEVTESNVSDGFGAMTIGFRKTGFTQYDWVVADNFRLTYYGKEKPTAIEGIEETVAPWQQNGTAIYNLQGQRLSRAQKGVNIIGGRKVMVK